MRWNDLFEKWKEKNKDVLIRTEPLADSAETAERVRKNVAVWFKSGDGISYRVVHAWVFNPNTESEEAYWEGGEPVLATAATATTTATFRDEAVKMLEDLKKNGEIMAYRLDTVDESSKTATAFTYVKTTEGVKEEKVLIAEVEGKIGVEKIV